MGVGSSMGQAGTVKRKADNSELPRRCVCAGVVARVRAHFAGQSYKATPAFWLKVGVVLALYVLCMTAMVTTGSLLAALAAGACMSSLKFCVTHDASHAAISRRPWVNKLCFVLVCNWHLWSHWMWHRHHVYGHHSYTGVYARDPDLINATIALTVLVRKTPELPRRPFHRFQSIYTWLLLMVLPNQVLGQSIIYWFAAVRRYMWTLSFQHEVMPWFDLLASVAVSAAGVYVQVVLPFRCLPAARTALPAVLLYWTTVGALYFANIVPNHDTAETLANVQEQLSGDGGGGQGHKVGRDWGEQQVRASGNHSCDGGLYAAWHTQWFGGINMQIEHHLFPSVSHMHYPAISRIVRQTCTEFGIPYVAHSWLGAATSFASLLRALG